jgi:phosphoesterase RecJ-like protein
MVPITDTHPFDWLGMLSEVLGSAVLDRDAAHGRGLVYTVIDDAARAGLRPEELDSVIDIMRTAREAGVAAVLKQTDPHSWQVSLRSRGPVDVAAAATALGGGGHVRAAGFTHHGDPLLAVDALRAVLDR